MALALNLCQLFASKWADFLGHVQQNAITALGTTQGTATALTGTIAAITTATAGVNDGVILPLITAVKAFPYIVYNGTAGNIKVYPGSGDNFYSSAANTPVTMGTGATLSFYPITSTTWVIR